MALFERLKNIQVLLEMCEKSLAEYLESKRRAFPRFFFVSTVDLLDILSNGNRPELVIDKIPKIIQAIGKLHLTLPKDPSQRPSCTAWSACVGKEDITMVSPLLLEGKVEVYMQDVINRVRETLLDILSKAVVSYGEMEREKWLFEYPNAADLVTSQMMWASEVFQAFDMLGGGNKDALTEYNQKQIDQLKRLIMLVQVIVMALYSYGSYSYGPI